MAEETLVREVTKTRKRNHRVSPAAVRISVIVNVQDRERDIRDVYASLVSGLKRKSYEIIFVENGSRDASWKVLKELANKDKKVKLIRFRNSFAESSAFDAGLKQARGEKIVFFTMRVKINAAQVSDLLKKLDDGCDLVMGWRHPRRDSELNQFISKMFNKIIRWVSKQQLHDINSGVFAARKAAVEDIPIYGNLNIFLPILASRQGYVVGDEKIEQLPGEFRQSKSLVEYIQRLLDILTVVFITNYSKKPLHFLGFVGSVFTLIGLGMNAYLFFYRLFEFGPIAGRPLLLLGALSLVIGIQMISIGLIGEMIIFTHAKEIKEYNIEEILD